MPLDTSSTPDVHHVGNRWVRAFATIALCGCLAPFAWGGSEGNDSAARGREALVAQSHILPSWSWEAYQRVGQQWEPPGPDPVAEAEAYAARFSQRYGLPEAPYPNNGLPMGLKKSVGRDGQPGLSLDCLMCHGGRIGDESLIGLGNTQLDLKALFDELTIADGRKPPFALFTLNSTRGTNNAGQIAVALLSMRNPDLSMRSFPIITGAWLPELDTPPWWNLGKKSTKYYDGRTDARAARSNMQFLLGDATLEELIALEPTYVDIDRYLKSLKPPAYPFPIAAERRDRGQRVFESRCSLCHGSYGAAETYPNVVVPLEEIGTDPARLGGLSEPFISHYNATWLGGDYPVVAPATGYQAPPLEGIWASAPYLHNGSVPTLWHVLSSPERPARFTRPPSTQFTHYDQDRVGWRFEVVTQEGAAAARKAGDRSIVDTTRWGVGNQGHTFGDDLDDEARLDLIEYLKSL